MEKKTGLEIWTEKVAYYGGTFLVLVVVLAGFAIIPWAYVLYYIMTNITLFLIVIAFGWRRHHEQKMEEDLNKLFTDKGIIMMGMKDIMKNE